MSAQDDEPLRVRHSREAFAAFDRLLATDDAGERAAILDALAEGSPEVHARVQNLLDADRSATSAGFLSGSAEQLIASEFAASASEPERQPGTTLGAYRLERLLGSGGMGEVWLGQRSDGLYDGSVAIKTLHPHLVRRGLRERFAREGRLLARLQHPNIARLLDAGVDAEGALFLVLEYVDGEPFDHWCALHQLDVPARLKLLIAVCAAVAEAHAQRIVHRDLKPSNILVTADGTVKLLDFGIAKLIEQDDQPDGDALTRIGGRALTPEYAAPEQIRGEPVTPASDVHALGVLLFETLTGVRPYDQPGATAAQVERAVLDQEPLPPSQAISDPALRRTLRGALDTITQRALKKRPSERYRNAAELADDLQRVLDDRPILARPDSLAERSARFVRRYRTGVIAAGLVLAALLIGLGAALWQADVARVAAQRADAETRKALAVKDFLVDVFERNSAGQRGGAMLRQARAEDLLARGAARIRGDLNEAPEIRAELLGTIGRLYRDLLLLPQALDLLAEEVQLRRSAATDAGGRAALARALLDQAAALTAAADYEASDTAVGDAMALLDAAANPAVGDRIDSLVIQGENAYWQLPSIDTTADRLFHQALALIEAQQPQHPRRLAVLLGLARTAEQAGDDEANQRRLREVLALGNAADSGWPVHDLASAHRQLGRLLHAQQRQDEARAELRTALALYQDSEGSDSPWTAISREELAAALADTGERGEALSLLDTALASLDPRAGSEQSDIHDSLSLAAGWLHYQRGMPEAAARLLLPALANSAREPAQLQAAMTRLARVRIAEGDHADARRLLDAALPILLADRGERSLAHLNWLAIDAELALVQGDPAQALAQLDKARSVWSPPDPARLNAHALRVEWDAARARIALGDAAAAEVAMRTLLATLVADPQLPYRPDEEAQTRAALGLALLAQARAADALPELHRALQLRERLDDPDGLWLAEVRLDLARALNATGPRAEADRLSRQAQTALARHPRLPAWLQPAALAAARKTATRTPTGAPP